MSDTRLAHKCRALAAQWQQKAIEKNEHQYMECAADLYATIAAAETEHCSTCVSWRKHKHSNRGDCQNPNSGAIVTRSFGGCKLHKLPLMPPE